MKRQCPGCRATSPDIVRNGFYFRTSDSRRIQRFKCKACNAHFSSATFTDTYRQKKRRINQRLFEEFASGTSMRRMALMLGVSRITVKRRLKFLANRARKVQERYLSNHVREFGPFQQVQFDDLHSFEHTKCKPNNVHLLVERETRIIIAHGVSQIPASGPLAAISRKKYGYREDHSPAGRNALFESVTPWVAPEASFETDEHALYPAEIKRHFPLSSHRQYKGLKGCVTGQGEMKKAMNDPLFDVNHTLAMLRYGISRLVRRTWCTTKLNERLADHVAIYTQYHNEVVLTYGASKLH